MKIDTTQIKEIFEFWKVTMHKNAAAKLDRSREAKIRARLVEGYSMDDIKQAVMGCAASGWHMGENPGGVKYNDLTLICRTGAKLEEFKDRYAPPVPKEQVPRMPYEVKMEMQRQGPQEIYHDRSIYEYTKQRYTAMYPQEAGAIAEEIAEYEESAEFGRRFS